MKGRISVLLSVVMMKSNNLRQTVSFALLLLAVTVLQSCADDSQNQGNMDFSFEIAASSAIIERMEGGSGDYRIALAGVEQKIRCDAGCDDADDSMLEVGKILDGLFVLDDSGSIEVTVTGDSPDYEGQISLGASLSNRELDNVAGSLSFDIELKDGVTPPQDLFNVSIIVTSCPDGYIFCYGVFTGSGENDCRTNCGQLDVGKHGYCWHWAPLGCSVPCQDWDDDCNSNGGPCDPGSITCPKDYCVDYEQCGP